MENIFKSVISKMNSFFGGLNKPLELFDIEARNYPYKNSDVDNITSFTVEHTGSYNLVYQGKIIDNLILESGNKVDILQKGPESRFIIYF